MLPTRKARLTIDAMLFSDLALSRRLEHAEGSACVQFAEVSRRLYPESGSEWLECAGVHAVFNGADSPITQTFGLGLNVEWNEAALDTIERFFFDRKSPVYHEVSPFAGADALDLLCRRNYRPVEITNVLYTSIGRPPDASWGPVSVRVIAPEETQLWTEINARGWAQDHPEYRDFLLEIGTISAASPKTRCFLASCDGVSSAVGVLFIDNGVALFGGAATVPEMRRRGLQTALLHERMRYASDHGCDVAMIGALPGSDSQRNAERKGFCIAYTRTKWKLFS
jgi:GNAT superfamily N-acetyltransferase